MDVTSRERTYCVTDYECNLEFWEKKYNEGIITYLFFGDEICPKTKKRHWQGWFHLKNGSTLSAVHKKFRPRHTEIMRGTVEQNLEYCEKEGKIIEMGKRPEQGERTDMVALKKMIKEGKSEKFIFEEQPGNYIRYNKGILKAMSLYDSKRDWEMDIRIYWGKSGSGKTRAVYDEFGIDNVYEKMVGKWWDGYEGEKVVIIDDLDPENCFDIAFDFYLKLLDRYPLKIEYKGGSRQFSSKIVIFTSNFDPKTWFESRKNREAFFRRVKMIKKF